MRGRTCAVAMVAALCWTMPAAGQERVLSERPVFTPYTQKPELRSLEETVALLDAMYPSQLREAGIGGTAIVWFLIDRTGEVKRTVLFQSSGFDALDEAALRVAAEMRFTPALNRDRPVDVWVQIPVTFKADARPRRADRLLEQPTPVDVSEGPMFTPYTEAPSLTNQEVVTAALQAAYPPLLRDAGIGGTANVWFLVDEEGRVVRIQIARTSGHEALDQAALAVARTMEFKPARNRGEKVRAWMQVPIRFASK